MLKIYVLKLSKVLIFKNFEYQLLKIRPLFQRSEEKCPDIIQKEVYEFEDRNGELLCLRPEGTAGLVRALITNGLMNDEIKNTFIWAQCLDMKGLKKEEKDNFFKQEQSS